MKPPAPIMQIVSGFIGFPSRSTLITDDAIAKNEREFRGGEMSVFFGRRKRRGKKKRKERKAKQLSIS